MRNKSIYVAGPMTGYPQYNFPAFDAAAVQLLAEGWSVVSPADHDRALGFDESKSIEDQAIPFDLTKALMWDLEQVSKVDAVYLLNGWEDSKGANAEYALAIALGKEIIFEAEAIRPRVILIGGALRAGKDTVADHLVEKYGFTKLGMSDPLLEALLALDPWATAGSFGAAGDHKPGLRVSDVIKQFGYTQAKAKSPEIRRLLQKLGTEVGRNIIGEDVWVDIATRRVQGHVKAGRSVVLTGIRFPNELDIADRIQGASVITAYVSRPSAEKDAAATAHTSEGSVKRQDFLWHIPNLGSIADLHSLTDSLVRQIG